MAESWNGIMSDEKKFRHKRLRAIFYLIKYTHSGVIGISPARLYGISDVVML
jgi:hypothetical protein